MRCGADPARASAARMTREDACEFDE